MFYDNICKICKDKGTTPTTILKELGYSTGNVTQWKKGSVPNVELCVAIARHLGITLDYLVTLSTSVQDNSLSESDQEWLDIICRIPAEKQEMCKDFLRTHMAVPEKYADEKKA